MARQWVTLAPNGSAVTINAGGYKDVTVNHNQIITDETIAVAYPHIFREINKAPDVTKPQILKEVTPPVVEKEEPKPELLQEEKPKKRKKKSSWK